MHDGTCPTNGLVAGKCAGVCDRCRAHRAVNEDGQSFCATCDRPDGPESGDLDEHGIPYL
jgi:hypothetical protein